MSYRTISSHSVSAFRSILRAAFPLALVGGVLLGCATENGFSANAKPRATISNSFLEGIFTDSSGEPLAGADVDLFLSDSLGETPYLTMTTGPDGSFRFDSLPQARYVVHIDGGDAQGALVGPIRLGSPGNSLGPLKAVPLVGEALRVTLPAGWNLRGVSFALPGTDIAVHGTQIDLRLLRISGQVFEITVADGRGHQLTARFRLDIAEDHLAVTALDLPLPGLRIEALPH